MEFPDDPIACMRRLHAAHGNIAALQEGTQRIIFVFGPELNQRVLSDSQTFHSRFFAVRGPRGSSQRRLTSGLLSMNGDEHKQNRRMVMGPLQKKTIANYHESICRLTNQMLRDWRIGDVRDMHEEMTQFMLRLTSAILFGLEVPELAYKIGSMIDRWVHMNHRMGMGVFVSDDSFTDNYEQLLELAEELEADIQTMIDLRRSDPNRDGDVLSLLIRAHDDEGILNDEKLIGNVALLFGAAHLTTAHTFTWTLFLLAQHPSIMRSVHEEIAGNLSGLTPSADEVTRLPLVERVVKESMRVLPASGYSQRMNVVDVELGPFHLSPGTAVIFSQFITHHMAGLYPQPNRFHPDRWLEISPSPYAYLPFGAGSRMCIGASLALMILQTALPMILKRYRLSVVPGTEVSGKIVSTMLGPSTSVPMLVSAQDGRFQANPVTGNIHTLVDLPEAPRTNEAPLRRVA